MNIVIATPPGILDNGKYLMGFPLRCDWVGEFPPGTHYYPFMLGYLSALLKRETDHDVVLVDGCIKGIDAKDYANHLASYEPDILITECSHLTYPTMTRVMKEVGAEQSILCGPIATVFSEKVITDGWIPIKGEYEKQVLDYLTFGMIPNENQEYIDIDWLPFPEDEDVSRIDYFCMSNPTPHAVQMYATRGCPLSCSYCTVPIYFAINGRTARSHRTRDPNLVCDEVQSLIDKYGDRFTGAFWNGDAHNADPRWLARLAQTLIDRGLNSYAYEATAGYWGWNEELVKLVAKAGYKQLRLGIETLDEEVGSGIGKRVVHKRLKQLLEWCREYGIRVHGMVMVGLPGSNYSSDMHTLELMLGLKADGLIYWGQHSPATPNPGTPFYFQAKKNGWLTTDDWNDYHWRNVVVSYPNYPREQIEQVRKVYYVLRAPLFRGDDGNIYAKVRAQ